MTAQKDILKNIYLSQTIKINLAPKKTSYDIIVGQGFFENFFDYIKDIKNINHYAIITDSTVKKLYGLNLLSQLKSKFKKKLKVDLLSFPAGEASKSQSVKTKLENQIFEKKCGRDTLIIALGGGVVGDLAGFIASTYMRGIPYVQVPTSLLAMVDSSVGGKTGINTSYGKNLIGAFWQPKKVIADIDCIENLPQKEFVNGLIEAIKMFFTHDAKMVDYCIQNKKKILKKDPKIIQQIITKAIQIKAGVVTRDECEANERMTMNFGHTICHAIEKINNYKIMHGYAVGLGIIVEAKISELLGLLSKQSYQLIENIIIDLGINRNDLKNYKTQDIIKLIKIDKKARNNKPLFVLLNDIGKVYKKNCNFAHYVDDKIVKKALEY